MEHSPAGAVDEDEVGLVNALRGAFVNGRVAVRASVREEGVFGACGRFKDGRWMLEGWIQTDVSS
jgi:hypothetical protein